MSQAERRRYERRQAKLEKWVSWTIIGGFALLAVAWAIMLFRG